MAESIGVLKMRILLVAKARGERAGVEEALSPVGKESCWERMNREYSLSPQEWSNHNHGRGLRKRSDAIEYWRSSVGRDLSTYDKGAEKAG